MARVFTPGRSVVQGLAGQWISGRHQVSLPFLLSIPPVGDKIKELNRFSQVFGRMYISTLIERTNKEWISTG